MLCLDFLGLPRKSDYSVARWRSQHFPTRVLSQSYAIYFEGESWIWRALDTDGDLSGRSGTSAHVSGSTSGQAGLERASCWEADTFWVRVSPSELVSCKYYHSPCCAIHGKGFATHQTERTEFVLLPANFNVHNGFEAGHTSTKVFSLLTDPLWNLCKIFRAL